MMLASERPRSALRQHLCAPGTEFGGRWIPRNPRLPMSYWSLSHRKETAPNGVDRRRLKRLLSAVRRLETRQARSAAHPAREYFQRQPYCMSFGGAEQRTSEGARQSRGCPAVGSKLRRRRQTASRDKCGVQGPAPSYTGRRFIESPDLGVLVIASSICRAVLGR